MPSVLINLQSIELSSKHFAAQRFRKKSFMLHKIILLSVLMLEDIPFAKYREAFSLRIHSENRTFIYFHWIGIAI